MISSFLVRICIVIFYYSPGVKKASGGSGGQGGNVYLQADPELNSLKFNIFHYNAMDGKHGGSMYIVYISVSISKSKCVGLTVFQVLC